MKIFLSYRFTGEIKEELEQTIKELCSGIEETGHSIFCSFWKADFYTENNFTNKQILEDALNEMDDCDAYLAFIKSNEKSEGMFIEAGYALSKGKKIIVAIKKGIKTTFLAEIAERLIEFDSLEDLKKKFKDL